ncbi:carbohydrate kinase family protein [candidate division KSB1 bacterium]
MNVAVLGTICLDEIRKGNADPRYGFGGLFYSVIALAQLIHKSGYVYPVVKIGENDYQAIEEQFQSNHTVDLKYAQKYPGLNNRVILEYFSRDERTEYSRFLPKPFTIKELAPLPDVDLFQVNFVSGLEMTHKTLIALKKRLCVPLFVDLHSLFLGFRKNGERYYRIAKNWSIWNISGDIVQMNEIEAAVLAGDRWKHSAILRNIIDRNKQVEGSLQSDRISFGKYLINCGARIVLITRGYAGSHVFWRVGKKIYEREIAAFHFGKVLDPTGCGDVYSAGFIYAFLSGAEPPEAAEFAGKVSGMRAARSSSGDLHRLRSLLEKEKIL